MTNPFCLAMELLHKTIFGFPLPVDYHEIIHVQWHFQPQKHDCS
jgi:hypothetical protein